MKKFLPIVISVGGSLIAPGGIDTNFLRQFRRLILGQIKKGKRFILIVGGGKIARIYQKSARQVAKLTDEDLDWLGIHATRLNAHLLRTIFRDFAFPQIIRKTRSGGLAWSLALNSSGNLRARFDTQIQPGTDGNNQSFETSAKIEDGAWHHVALTYDYPTRTVRIYKDYVKVLESVTANPLWVDAGNSQIGAGDMAFDGWIDEVRLTDRVLEPTAFLYSLPLPGMLFYLQ